MQALLPLFISPVTGKSTTEAVSLGAMGDSYYEYLLKVWPARAGMATSARAVAKGCEDFIAHQPWKELLTFQADDLLCCGPRSKLHVTGTT